MSAVLNTRSPALHPLNRLLRFNLVGALGVGVQLGMVALLNRSIPHHYLLTSTLAVELTLLHNFVWHLRYTWPGSSTRTQRIALTQLVRFHLSNGLVSLLGNLTLMRLFVHSGHLSILVANALAILCCGLANFSLADYWVFAPLDYAVRVLNVRSQNDHPDRPLGLDAQILDHVSTRK
jgi:putative flippase GtrA